MIIMIMIIMIMTIMIMIIVWCASSQHWQVSQDVEKQKKEIQLNFSHSTHIMANSTAAHRLQYHFFLTLSTSKNKATGDLLQL